MFKFTSVRTEITPITHPAQDEDSLPKVSRYIANLSDEEAEDEANSLIREGKEEERAQCRDIVRRECRDDVGEDEAR